MTTHFLRDLERLKKDLLTMGAKVEEAIRKAIVALHDRRPEVADEVIRGDDELDEIEVEIEDECLKILALHQPVANDLRFLTAVLKINNDLERMGDLAANIAERAAFLATIEPIPVPRELWDMTEATTRMVRESLDAFVQRDAGAARAVCAEDDRVDDYNRRLIEKLQDMMKEYPSRIEAAICFFSACRQLERIADHATNIAEDVVYLVEGQIIRHRQ